MFRLRVPSLTAVAALAVLAVIFVLALTPRFDADFWWHLKDGQYIAAHHSVPSHDFMSYVFAGHAWTDHEWLPELTIYFLFRLAGLQGCVLFFGVVVALTFTCVYLNMVQRGIRRLLAIVVLIPAALASTSSWGPRIQMLTLLFLAIYALVLHRFEITRDRRLLAALPIVMVLWANSHGGFVLGLALLIMTLAGEFLNRHFHHDDALSLDDIRWLTLASFSAFVVTFLNPNGVRQLLYPLSFLAPNPFTNVIAESASPNFHLFFALIFGVMLLALITVLYFGRHTTSWTHLLMILAMTYLALDQSRNVPIWCVLISPLLATQIQQALRWVYVDKRLAGGIKSVVNVVCVALIAATTVRGGMAMLSTSTMSTYVAASFPVKAVASMRAHLLPSHVFADYTWAGYVLWQAFPQYRVFMDSRADTVYTASILNGYLNIFEARPGWKSKLVQYQVDDVLVPPHAPLAQVLAQDAGWRLAYRDSSAVEYVRLDRTF